MSRLTLCLFFVFVTVCYFPNKNSCEPIRAPLAGNSFKVLPDLGRPMREEFLLDENFIQLNHGAYGTYPKTVQQTLHEYQNRSERNAELWIRREARTELDKVRKVLAEYLNADEDDLVVVPNTTSGINAVFRSMVFNFGEKILHFSTIYGAMKSLIQYVCDYSNGGVTSAEFEVNYPISDDDLVAAFEVFLNENHRPDSPFRIALIDHISSTPGVINPLERFIPLLKSRNITVLIDGAHAIGQITIDLSSLGADYYITNCHKWLYAARGSAVMYVRKELQGSLHPASISSNYAQPSRLQDEFFWTGTIDYSSYMTVPTAIEFRKTIGEDVIRNYTHSLAIAGGNLIAQRFGTRVLQTENQIGCIVDVELPISNPEDETLTGDYWIDTLLYRFNVYCSPYKHNGRWWIRISAQIYNDLSDFEAAAVVFQTICDEVNGRQTLIAHE